MDGCDGSDSSASAILPRTAAGGTPTDSCRVKDGGHIYIHTGASIAISIDQIDPPARCGGGQRKECNGRRRRLQERRLLFSQPVSLLLVDGLATQMCGTGCHQTDVHVDRIRSIVFRLSTGAVVGGLGGSAKGEKTCSERTPIQLSRLGMVLVLHVEAICGCNSLTLPTPAAPPQKLQRCGHRAWVSCWRPV
jgi:hypothetical protein